MAADEAGGSTLPGRRRSAGGQGFRLPGHALCSSLA